MIASVLLHVFFKMTHRRVLTLDIDQSDIELLSFSISVDSFDSGQGMVLKLVTRMKSQIVGYIAVADSVYFVHSKYWVEVFGLKTVVHFLAHKRIDFLLAFD